MKIINLLLKGVSWFFAIMFILFAFVPGFSLSSIIFLLSGISIMPLEPIRNLWKKLPVKGFWVKPVALFIAFFIAVMCMPETENTSVPDTEITSSEILETEDAFLNTESNGTAIENSEIASESEKLEVSTKLPANLTVSAADIPSYAGKDYVTINGNKPLFDTSNLSAVSYEYYSELDSLGRCGVVHACIGKELMPTEERGSIGHIKPSGWHTVKYNGVVDGNYLYNRCHLIGYQLTGENDNEKNLITGTRQFNVDGMLPFENMVADYIKETNNHVMYRVTPVFDGNNLLATGVLMEAWSIEDNGRGICFNVFVYNVQDGITINYANGNSYLTESATSEPEVVVPPAVQPEPEKEFEKEQQSVSSEKFAVNSKNGKIHKIGDCSATGNGDNAMTDPVYFDTYEEALEYSKRIAPELDKRDCGNCW